MGKGFYRSMALLLAAALTPLSWAEGQFIDIAPRDASEIALILETLESAVETDRTDAPPIVMMLHGEPANHFMRQNYAQNKALVDLTAKLSAFEVIEVQVCEIWLEENGLSAQDLFPFAEPVPFGAGELERLMQDEKFTEYSIDL